MRVLHLIKAAGIAGAERHLLDLLPSLRAHDIDAQFLLLAPPDDAAASFIDAAHALDIPTQTIALPRTASFSALRALIGALRTAKPDIVHTHLIHADVYGIPAARLAGIRRVFSSRHNDDPRRQRLSLAWLDKVLFYQLETAICISDAVKKAGLAAGLPEKKLKVIHYGLPLGVRIDPLSARVALRERLRIPADANVIGMVCRLVEAKGISYALEGFAKVMLDYPKVHFAIAGDGPLRPELEAQVATLKLGRQVTFLGWHDAPLEMMAGLDVLLAPSVREGFGLNLLEAMSQAIPILGSTASALPEIILDGKTGLTVPPADSEALATALKTLLGDGAMRRRMGEAGLVRARTHFSAEKTLQAHIRLYEGK